MLVLLSLMSVCGQSSPPDERDSESRRGICEVHGTALLQETVAPVDMTVEFEIEYHRIMQSQFPNLGLAFAIDHPGEDSVVVEYCPECREANRLWVEEY